MRVKRNADAHMVREAREGEEEDEEEHLGARPCGELGETSSRKRGKSPAAMSGLVRRTGPATSDVYTRPSSSTSPKPCAAIDQSIRQPHLRSTFEYAHLMVTRGNAASTDTGQNQPSKPQEGGSQQVTQRMCQPLVGEDGQTRRRARIEEQTQPGRD